VPLLSEAEQRKYIPLIESRLAKAADEVRNNWKNERSGYVFSNFVIWFYTKATEWLGMELLDEANQDTDRKLQFTTFSPKSGTGQCAAAFLEEGESLFLLHDGRVFPRDGRARPSAEHYIKVGNKNYYVVCDLKAENFFDGIIEFQLSRGNPDLAGDKVISECQEPSASGFDPGPENPGKRTGGATEARQAPIVKALMLKFEERGFKPQRVISARPDLFLENRKGDTILIEVKSDSKFNSFCTAIGQIQCYSIENKSDRKFIVSPKIDPQSSLSRIVIKVMAKNQIEHFHFELNGKDIIFPKFPSNL
jgi:hypothetical protein